jgi:hypothetical protein
MHRSTHIDDDERDALAGVSDSSSSARRAGQTAEIIQFIPRNAAAEWDDDAGEFDDTFESIGSLAVRLVASWYSWQPIRREESQTGCRENQTICRSRRSSARMAK